MTHVIDEQTMPLGVTYISIYGVRVVVFTCAWSTARRRWHVASTMVLIRSHNVWPGAQNMTSGQNCDLGRYVRVTYDALMKRSRKCDLGPPPTYVDEN